MELVRAVTTSIGKALGAHTEFENYVATGLVYEILHHTFLANKPGLQALLVTGVIGLLLFFVSGNTSHNQPEYDLGYYDDFAVSSM